MRRETQGAHANLIQRIKKKEKGLFSHITVFKIRRSYVVKARIVRPYQRFYPLKLHPLVTHFAPPFCFRLLSLLRMRFSELL